MAEEKTPSQFRQAVGSLATDASGLDSIGSEIEDVTIELALASPKQEDLEVDDPFNKPDPITSALKSAYDFTPAAEQVRYPNSNDIDVQVGHRSFGETSAETSRKVINQKSNSKLGPALFVFSLLLLALAILIFIAPQFRDDAIKKLQSLNLPEFSTSFFQKPEKKHTISKGSYSGVVVYSNGSITEDVTIHAGRSTAVVMAKKFCSQGQLNTKNNSLTCGAKSYRLESKGDGDTITIDVYDSVFKVGQMRLKK